MAKIIKHGKYYNENTGELNIYIDVLCPECVQVVSSCISAFSKNNKLPCKCYNCGCEFIPTEEDIVEEKKADFQKVKGRI